MTFAGTYAPESRNSGNPTRRFDGRLSRTPPAFYPGKAAVHNDIVCVPFKADRSVMLSHPLVESKVEEDVGEQRTDDAPLRCALIALQHGPVR